jgi:hypothetical protein
MKDDILTYREMCDREDVQTLQRGMNFRLNPHYSVILMSLRSNAPYQDEILSDGLTIIYEGHDAPRSHQIPDPKTIDQPRETPKGTLTQNGKFVQAIENRRRGKAAEQIRVYEKLFNGVWSYKGAFDLVDYKYVTSGNRKVFRFKLRLGQESVATRGPQLKERTRVIPTHVKKVVWQRDGGKCVQCGATDELHFDHDLPYSKGGTSISPENVRILCARHNLQKSDKIQ